MDPTTEIDHQWKECLERGWDRKTLLRCAQCKMIRHRQMVFMNRNKWMSGPQKHSTEDHRLAINGIPRRSDSADELLREAEHHGIRHHHPCHKSLLYRDKRLKWTRIEVVLLRHPWTLHIEVAKGSRTRVKREGKISTIPINIADTHSTFLPVSAYQSEPAELGTRSRSQSTNQPGAAHSRPSQDSYYEDIEPRFSHDEEEPTVSHSQPPQLPASLLPGGIGGGYAHLVAPDPRTNTSSTYDDGDGDAATITQHNQYLTHDYQYGAGTGTRGQYGDPDRDDSRSPARSDNSNFTSISQRGVNPDWQPPPGSAQYYGHPPPAAAPRRNDVLDSNPDFSIPGAARPGHVRGGSGTGSVAGAYRYPTY